MITLKYLKSILYYHPESGDWIWIVKTSKYSPIKIGTQAGCLSKYRRSEYILIRINNIEYKAHILAWFYMTGKWPKEQVDHKNHIKHENWWNNLRECNNSQNQSNKGLNKNNKSGAKGVSWYKPYNKWLVKIGINNKRIHLGYFDCKEDAICAYNEAAIKYFGEFAYLNPS